MTRGIAILAFVALTSSAQHFPPLDQDNRPKSRSIRRMQFCMIARKDIPVDAPTPLFTFDFAPPGASGSILIDGKTVKAFKDEQHLRIGAKVAAGQHTFNINLDRPATNTFMVSNPDFTYCRG